MDLDTRLDTRRGVSVAWDTRQNTPFDDVLFCFVLWMPLFCEKLHACGVPLIIPRGVTAPHLGHFLRVLRVCHSWLHTVQEGRGLELLRLLIMAIYRPCSLLTSLLCGTTLLPPPPPQVHKAPPPFSTCCRAQEVMCRV